MTKTLLYTWFDVVKVHKVVKVVNVDSEPRIVNLGDGHNQGTVTNVGLGRKCKAGRWVRKAAIATERKGYYEATIYQPVPVRQGIAC